MKLAILDISGSIEQAVELAPYAESLGYRRWWIAEHQPQATPMLSVALVAGVTDELRVGTAGILLHYYPTQRTAHDFQFLERAYDGRIDAGFCAGLDTRLEPEELDGVEINAVMAKYYERATRLVRHLRNVPGDPEFDPATAWPDAPESPPMIWSLGGTLRSAEFAARNGLSYAYSLLYPKSFEDPEPLQRYRESFVPVRSQAAPWSSLAVCAICTETAAEAQTLAASVTGAFFTARVIGDAETCLAQLAALQARYAPDEIVIATLGLEFPARKRCLELLAPAIGAP
ncbi:MAG TPA: LLM class flavin-dependent oxidoreductase [Kofleriaceae bacterium]